MFKALVMLVLFVVLGSLACTPQDRSATPPPPDSLASVALYDVQGLYGGRNLYLTGEGTLLVSTVTPGLREQRHRLQLPAADVAALERLLFDAHPIGAIAIPERMGVPDEARPALRVTTRAGAEREVAKWANDVHEDFDALYRALLALETRAVEEGERVFDGEFSWDWRPDGF